MGRVDLKIHAFGFRRIPNGFLTYLGQRLAPREVEHRRAVPVHTAVVRRGEDGDDGRERGRLAVATATAAKVVIETFVSKLVSANDRDHVVVLQEAKYRPLA